MRRLPKRKSWVKDLLRMATGPVRPAGYWPDLQSHERALKRLAVQYSSDVAEITAALDGALRLIKRWHSDAEITQ